MGVQTSLVRSINLDMWTERQLKLLEAGGNAKLHDFLENYNLNSVDIKLKYQTKAMLYYRKRNEATALEREFKDEEPSVEEGRQLQDGRQLDKDGQVLAPQGDTPIETEESEKES